MRTNLLITTLSLIFLSNCTPTRMYRGRNMGVLRYTLLPGLNSPSDGRFIFEESRSLAEQSALPYSVALTGSYQKWGDTIKLRTAAELFINRHLVSPQNDTYYGDFDSSESSLLLAHQFDVSSVKIKDTNSFDNFHTTLYFPAAIHLNLANYIPMGFDRDTMIQGSPLRPGQALAWNADPRNTGGVAIILEYEAYSTENTVAREHGNRRSVTNYAIVPDNGVYTLTRQFMKKFPRNGIVQLTIMRGNSVEYQLPKDPQKKVYFVVMTKETGLFQFNPTQD